MVRVGVLGHGGRQGSIPMSGVGRLRKTAENGVGNAGWTARRARQSTPTLPLARALQNGVLRDGKDRPATVQVVRKLLLVGELLCKNRPVKPGKFETNIARDVEGAADDVVAGRFLVGDVRPVAQRRFQAILVEIGAVTVVVRHSNGVAEAMGTSSTPVVTMESAHDSRSS